MSAVEAVIAEAISEIDGEPHREGAHADDARCLLRFIAAAGYAIVPVEPTREMWAAGANALTGDQRLGSRLGIAPDFITEPVYRAMVAASQAS